MKSNNTPPRPNSSEDKFPNTYQIVEMLKAMKEKHDKINMNLVYAGEQVRTKPWKSSSINVQDIIDYIYEKEGLEL